MSRRVEGADAFRWMGGLLLFLHFATAALTQPKTDLEGGDKAVVFKAWKERAAKLRSLRVQWTAETTISKGSLSPALAGIEGMKGPIPVTDSTFPMKYLVSLDGPKMRFHHNGMGWSVPNKNFVSQEYDSTFDGKESVLFWAKDQPTYPKGIIRKENKNIEIRNYNLIPIIFTYRPFDPAYSVLVPASLKSLRERVVVNGNPCIVFRESGRPSALLSTIYVDPQEGFSIVRYTLGQEDKPFVQIDIRYDNDQQFGYLPSAWETQELFPAGKLRTFASCSVSEMIVNPVFTAEEFKVEFPVGTYVTDFKHSTNSMGASYIVRSGGKRRVILDEEVLGKASYDELLNSETGQALNTGQSGNRTWVLLALLVFLIGAAWWGLRGWRRGQHSSHPLPHGKK